ncbi:unnamed protein product [Staurois parvus]|uniref:Uncharacterized protein n=1 Tax=Staurois parvus TaxID=386267 RepID=A0ABN9DCG0_9NEOB|nr:unnamed protein product [Staurois parvus]
MVISVDGSGSIMLCTQCYGWTSGALHPCRNYTVPRNGLTIWKLGHCLRAQGQ